MSWYASVKELCFIQKYWGIGPTPILMLEQKYQGQCFFCKWRASNGFSEKKNHALGTSGKTTAEALCTLRWLKSQGIPYSGWQ